MNKEYIQNIQQLIERKFYAGQKGCEFLQYAQTKNLKKKAKKPRFILVVSQ